MTSLLWFRRDLRLHDHPALHAAAAEGPVVALFVLDPALMRPSGAARVAFLYATLRELDADLHQRGGRLVVRRGKPETVVPKVVRDASADAVFVSEDFGPYGRRRDDLVADALGAIPLLRHGSPYAISPGRVVKSDGSPYQVYSPFYRAWKAHGWRDPLPMPRAVWVDDVTGIDVPQARSPRGVELPAAGEAAARSTWRAYRESFLGDYGDVRDRPDLDRTSHLSVYLKWGCIHPRTLLADLGPRDEVFRRELAWRDFYASVLFHWPASARDYFQPKLASLPYAEPDERFDAWCAGRTGYPIVDAGMRQLRALGWMHNRVRMIVASFLVKDLHIEWTHGARFFMQNLVDADLASNQHGWQWTAGTGTDPAPFFRIFNPVTQGRTYDPDGDYVRRWVPELRDIEGAAVHEPWKLAEPPVDYPDRIVDHATERVEALRRYESIR